MNFYVYTANDLDLYSDTDADWDYRVDVVDGALVVTKQYPTHIASAAIYAPGSWLKMVAVTYVDQDSPIDEDPPIDQDPPVDEDPSIDEDPTVDLNQGR